MLARSLTSASSVIRPWHLGQRTSTANLPGRERGHQANADGRRGGRVAARRRAWDRPRGGRVLCGSRRARRSPPRDGVA
jgi:hypothetical protein